MHGRREGAAAGPQPLTHREREVLDHLLSAERPGVAELRQQAKTALATPWDCCGCASIDLSVDREAAPQSSIRRMGPAVEAKANERAERFVELLLWVDDGWLSALEVVNYEDDPPPTELPPPADLGLPSPVYG
jgi:hypothetical protein